MRKYFKPAADLIFYSNLWISLGAASMVWETYLLLGQIVDFFYVAFAFCATMAIYNLDRLVVLNKLTLTGNVRHQWIVENKYILFVSFALCGVFLGVSIFYLPIKIIIFLSHLAVISIAYSIPMFTHRKEKRSLRSLNGLKIFLIAYVWMAATAMLPSLAAGHSLLEASVISITLRRGLFIFAITIPFDIRDLRTDHEAGLRTLPGIFGVKKSQWLAIFCLVVFTILAAFDHSLYSPSFYALLISAISTAPLVFIASEHFNEYYFAGLLDGTILVQFLLVYIFAYLW
jgi:4-hydroxybenzoate polyprenyltransferase